jgi:hypothetical protein
MEAMQRPDITNLDDVDDVDDMCSICHLKKEHQTKTDVCFHFFCQTCLVGWYKECIRNRRLPCCPLCRKIVDVVYEVEN